MFSWHSVCGTAPAVMGIVNVTPDSFSDGGRYLDRDTAVAHGLALMADGAAVLDVGGESTRPGADPVGEDEERDRVVPVVAALAAEGCVVSVDTTKAAVAAAAIDAGAAVVNDVSAARHDPEMLPLVAARGVGLVLMHMQGEPRTMQHDPRYDDVFAEVGDFLEARLAAAHAAGIAVEALCADPGIGFGKTGRHNLELLARVQELVARVEVPLLVGTSRKTFLGAIVAGDDAPVPPPDARDDATLATACWAIDRGVRLLRVHEVRPVAEAIRMMTLMTSLDARAVA